MKFKDDEKLPNLQSDVDTLRPPPGREDVFSAATVVRSVATDPLMSSAMEQFRARHPLPGPAPLPTPVATPEVVGSLAPPPPPPPIDAVEVIFPSVPPVPLVQHGRRLKLAVLAAAIVLLAVAAGAAVRGGWASQFLSTRPTERGSR